MGYRISDEQLTTIAEGFQTYYDDLWTNDIKQKLTTDQMGFVRGLFTKLEESFQSLRDKSSQLFIKQYKEELTLRIKAYFANNSDNARLTMKLVDQLALKLIKQIPVVNFVVSTAYNKASQLADNYLEDRSLTEADKVLLKDGQFDYSIKSVTEVKEALQQSIESYKLFCNYLKVLPENPETLEDVIAYPMGVFRILQASSAIKLNLWNIGRFIKGMEVRVSMVGERMDEYRKALRSDFKEIIRVVLDNAYADGYDKGWKDGLANNHYTTLSRPDYSAPQQNDAARLLAAYTAHAYELGFFHGMSGGEELQPLVQSASAGIAS